MKFGMNNISLKIKDLVLKKFYGYEKFLTVLQIKK